MTGRLVVASCVAAVLCCACGAPALQAAATAPAPSRTRPAPTPTTITVWQPLRGFIDLGRQEDGSHAALTAGSRLSRSADGRWAMGADLVHGELVAAVRQGGAWRFADRSGHLWSAPSFLGPLEPAGSLGHGGARWSYSRGVVAGVPPTGAGVLLSDGTREASIVGDLPLLDVSFLDPQHGLASVDGGLLALTADAGQSWRVVEGRAFPTLMRPRDGYWRLTYEDRGTEARFLHVFPDGRSEEAGAVPPPWVGTEPEMRVGLARDLPQSAIEGTVLDGWAIGAFHSNRHLLRVRVGSGEHELIRDALPSAGCRVVRWGTRLAAICDGTTESTSRLLASDDGRSFREVTVLDVPRERISEAHLALSADGRTAAWNDYPYRRVATYGASSLRDVPALTVQDVSDRGVLGSTEDGVAVAGGAPATLTFAALPTRLSEVHARWLPDGTIWVAGYEGRAYDPETFACYRGVPGGTLSRVPLPGGASTVFFVGAERGVAAGRSLAELWRTTNGGERWERVPVGDESESTRVVFGFTSSWCDLERCVVSGTYPALWEQTLIVELRGWGPLPPSVTRVRAAAPPLQPERRAWHPVMDALRLLCTSPPDARVTSPPIVAAPTNASVLDFGYGLGRGRLVLETSGRARVEWSGRDERGAFAGATAAAPFPAAFPGDGPTMVTAARLDRGGVDLRLCRERPERICRVALARPGRVLAVSALETAARAAVGLPEGGVAWLDDESRLSVLGSDGASVSARSPLVVHSELTAVGLVAGAPVVLAWLTSGHWYAYAARADALPVHVGEHHGPIAVCRSPRPSSASGGAPAVIVATTELRIGFSSLSGEGTDAQLEIGPSATCIRSIDQTSRYGSGLVQGRVEAQPDGTLTGSIAAEPGIRPAVCRVELQELD